MSADPVSAEEAYGLRAIGVDPGPVPGVVVLDYWAGRLLRALVLQHADPDDAALAVRNSVRVADLGRRVVVEVERFVVGYRSSRSSTAAAGQATRRVAEQCVEAASWPGCALRVRDASTAKAWATDDRLRACLVPTRTHPTRDLPTDLRLPLRQACDDLFVPADLYARTRGLRHARDAARHALYAAVADGGIPDPLSARGRTEEGQS